MKFTFPGPLQLQIFLLILLLQMLCFNVVFLARDMRPDEGQSEYEEVQKELSSKEEELEVIAITSYQL